MVLFCPVGYFIHEFHIPYEEIQDPETAVPMETRNFLVDFIQ